MAADQQLRWLRTREYSGVAEKLAEFCKKDIVNRAQNEANFDEEIYSDAVKLILEKLREEQSL